MWKGYCPPTCSYLSAVFCTALAMRRDSVLYPLWYSRSHRRAPSVPPMWASLVRHSRWAPRGQYSECSVSTSDASPNSPPPSSPSRLPRALFASREAPADAPRHIRALSARSSICRFPLSFLRPGIDLASFIFVYHSLYYVLHLTDVESREASAEY